MTPRYVYTMRDWRPEVGVEKASIENLMLRGVDTSRVDSKSNAGSRDDGETRLGIPHRSRR